MHSGRSLALLAVATAVLATQAGERLIDFVCLPFVIALLAAELDRDSGHLARSIVALAARLIPAARRADERDEWLDHVETAGERGLLPLTRALSIALVAAPLLAIGLRVGRGRKRTTR